MKLHVEVADAFFYPDVFVTYDPRDRDDPLAVRHPLLIVEVLSDSTAAYDRVEIRRKRADIGDFERAGARFRAVTVVSV